MNRLDRWCGPVRKKIKIFRTRQDGFVNAVLPCSFFSTKPKGSVKILDGKKQFNFVVRMTKPGRSKTGSLTAYS
jgi:hypothetical protein